MLIVKTKLNKSNISGIGVFADQIISKGDVVWSMRSISVFKVTTDHYKKLSEIEKKFIKEKDYYWLDEFNNYMIPIDDSRFINHSNNPNLVELNDGNYIASKTINIDEELTIDYKTLIPKEYWEKYML